MDWQEYSVWGITALTLISLIKKAFPKKGKGKPICTSSCSCPANQKRLR